MSLIDEIDPTKALESAEAENRATARSTWTAGETQRSRILLQTTTPGAIVTIGYPTETFGYPGISMQAKNYFFLDVDGRARLQFGKPVTWVAQSQWYQYAGKEIVLGGGGNAVFAVRNRFLLSAGGGYGAGAVADTGEMLPDGTWNSTDMNEILDATHWGLREFDEESEELGDKHRARLGYAVPTRPPAPPAAVGKMAKLVAFLGGETPKPTMHSQGIARLLDLKGGSAVGDALNVLEKVGRIVNAVTKLISDPAAIPFVGPMVLEKLDQLKSANGSLRELMTAPQVGIAAGRLGTSKGDNPYDATMHWLKLFGDMANRIVRLKNAAKDLLVTVAKFLGVMAPSPSVLGLIGRDGVSLVTHDDVFAWAPNGFRFVSAKNAEDYPVDPATRLLRYLRQKEQALEDKLKGATGTIAGPLGSGVGNFLFGKSPPKKVAADPSFRVAMDANVELRAGEDATIAAWGPEGRLRAEGSLAAELVASNVVGLAARHGVVEIMGREVTIGVPARGDAKKAAQELASPLVAAEERLVAELRETYEYDAQALLVAEAKITAVQAKRRLELTDLGNSTPGGMHESFAVSALHKSTLELIALEATLPSKKAAVEVSRELLTHAEKELLDARARAGSVINTSRTASIMDWKANQQAVAQRVGVHARDDVTLFSGKTLTIESGKAIEIKAEDLQTPSIDKATIKVEKEIQLEVGRFKVTVTKEKVIVNNGAGEILVIDGSSADIKTPQGARVLVKNSEVRLEAPTDAQILANGKILLG